MDGYASAIDSGSPSAYHCRTPRLYWSQFQRHWQALRNNWKGNTMRQRTDHIEHGEPTFRLPLPCPSLSLGSLMIFALWMAVGATPAAASELTWKQTPSSLALLDGKNVVWQFNYAKGEGKPYFHPVTVAGSPSLTDLRPADHPWHLALWFSWKFINGLNYWEENRQTGKSDGTTEVLGVDAVARQDHAARFQLKLAYHPPGQRPVLTESRTIEVSSPATSGGWHIDWRSTFTAGAADVRLDRTPILGEPGGVSYGGYAGLSLRLAPALRQWRFVGANGPVSSTNTRSPWMSFSGPLPDGKAATILVLDHPRNLRHPTGWYLINGMPYFSPALLYYSPYVLPAGQSIGLQSRIVFSPGELNVKAAESEWKQFASQPEKP